MGVANSSTLPGADVGAPRRVRSVLAEGVIAGVLGASAVALWFLIVDFARGRPFLVPAALGHGLLHATGLAGREGMLANVVMYTIFHYAAFLAIGVLAALLLRRAEGEPLILAGAFLLFIVFEVGFYIFSSVIAESPVLGAPSWYMVTVGNLLAAAVMGVYLWRAHPGLGGQLDHALSGRELTREEAAETDRVRLDHQSAGPTKPGL